ncbi:MAG TPA: carboxypeptidase-like regulatory domain-containing protein, partial [Bacteroidia bacterium]|nr:carboxypeptidase-like regulatory domain-containing protein [Bacteroidia bacterium]
MLKNALLFLSSLLILLSSSPEAKGQVTRVSGRVYDPLTNEPVAFASILFLGTTTGKNTDIDGNFSIETMENVDSLRVTFIGYLPATLPVQRHKTQVINIALRANKFDLPEVVIKAGENPALILLRKVLDNKPKNDRSELTSFQYESYNKLEFDINNITDKFKQKRIFKPFQ